MYSGRVIDDLMEMVARAESHAQELKAAAPVETQPLAFYAPRYAYETTNQQVYVGVA